MIEQNARPARKVGIADHLWETYEDMAQQMGSDRDALINQALFLFARLHGFIEVKAGRAEGMPSLVPVASAPPAPARPSSARVGPALAPVPNGARSQRGGEESGPAPAARAAPRAVESDFNPLDNDPERKKVAERVIETAAQLERIINGKSGDSPRESLDNDLLGPDESSRSGESDLMSGVDELEAAGPTLYLTMDGAESQRIIKDRFVIGRGKHCDLVINSGKVSREHAVILREGSDFFIEDLGSSNGTWFNKQRIKRRKVDDGDEYFICSERVRLTFR
jgi:hypothetical protein